MAASSAHTPDHAGAIWRSVCGSGPTPSGNRLTATRKKAIGSSASTRRRATSRRSRATMVAVNKLVHAVGIDLQHRGRRVGQRQVDVAGQHRRATATARRQGGVVRYGRALGIERIVGLVEDPHRRGRIQARQPTRRRCPARKARHRGMAAVEQADAPQRLRCSRVSPSPWPCRRARNRSDSSTERSSFSGWHGRGNRASGAGGAGSRKGVPPR